MRPTIMANRLRNTSSHALANCMTVNRHAHLQGSIAGSLQHLTGEAAVRIAPHSRTSTKSNGERQRAGPSLRRSNGAIRVFLTPNTVSDPR